MNPALHPLDDALALTEAGPGRYTARTSPAYWNMVGPFGGITAAVLLQAVMQHPERLGDPLSLTVNYAGAIGEGEFTVQAVPVRTNRSTQHWTLSVLQPGADGEPVVTTTATVVTAVRRETWSLPDTPMPEVAGPEGLERVLRGMPVKWLDRYDLRPVAGALPSRWDGGGDSSLSQLWMRDEPARPLDFCALAALADVFFPRVWLRRARQVPAGTVSLTVYFHASREQLTDTGSGYLLGQARAQEFRNGFFDQTVQLWNQGGTMLASSHQIVYYKE
ncbi:thioesterase family protein [Acidovorax sp. NCPPB 3859]|uniref:acyl-CoA thioesterase n=1 Tax=Paracidovorax avenae TaxID=80867 RepID=UPI000D2285EC|nr:MULTISPECIES: thioesterase family protein [Comamonadaceae]AVS65971.1 acyl-CoA thioesterase [Paracidovorax avenae]MDA8448157.1 thioesterase family protein [Acidovorax sp. GBBC 3297]MDA8457876.1 thioesterase family protein [Acidovorax sp. GBBC 3333]MDA8462600.1 thioesterase family protein [Acidovorax sp. GBBC 3332]MDA8467946.1 thioesterase family protein [Acidovorax sp. GBBC 3299]